MTRKEELLNLIGDDKTIIKLVDEVCFLEKQLDYLKALPQINVNPNNPYQQKTTPAAKAPKNGVKIPEIKAINRLMMFCFSPVSSVVVAASAAVSGFANPAKPAKTAKTCATALPITT